MLRTYYIVRCTNNARNTTKRNSLLSQTYEPRRYASSNKGTPAPLRTMQPKHESTLNKKTAPLPVRSSIATTPCRKVTAAYALNHLKLQVLKPTLAYRNKFQFLSANIIALIGTVLYNAIKEYYNDRTRKIIHFYSHTVEDNYNAIRKKSNVTVPDDHHDNDVNNILIKCTDNERQRYNTLIEDYNRAGKREDNILTIDKCRTMRLRESSEKIHDILLREFRRANNFTESITHNDDEQV
ncbi:hypothetical protein HBI64_014100 [Parastagonospora nodorum]|nr:hypothetical protein HBI64_014100 [Parastagonospora nodorum]